MAQPVDDANLSAEVIVAAVLHVTSEPLDGHIHRLLRLRSGNRERAPVHCTEPTSIELHVFMEVAGGLVDVSEVDLLWDSAGRAP